MTGLPIAARALADRRRAIAGWGVGLVLYVALIAAIFPTVEGSEDLRELFDRYPEAVRAFVGGGGVDITSGPGYVDSELFGFMLPLLVAVLAIVTASGLLAGEEDRGLLDLVASLPVSRRRIVAEKAVAMVAEVTLVVALVAVALAAGDLVVGLDLDAGRVAAACAALALLGILFGGLSLAVGAMTPGRGRSAAIPAAFAAAAFVLEGLQQVVDVLHPWRFASPFHYALGAPLTRGVGAVDLLVLGAAAAVACGVAVLAIDRRDLRG